MASTPKTKPAKRAAPSTTDVVVAADAAVATDAVAADAVSADAAVVTTDALVTDNQAVVAPESVVAALLFSTDSPLSAGRIASLLGVGDAGDVRRHIESLNARFEKNGDVFRIEEIAKGYQMLTLPMYHPWVSKLHKAQAESRLSGAALETLAIVAYKQPVLRADVETVRGVAVGDMLVRLREMNLVRIVGRAEEIGRPLLYGTTSRFLDVFGLKSLTDLPKLDPDAPNPAAKLRVVGAASSNGSTDIATASDAEQGSDSDGNADHDENHGSESGSDSESVHDSDTESTHVDGDQPEAPAEAST